MVEQSSIRFSKIENIFAWGQAFAVLQHSFLRSEGKMFSHVILFQILTYIILVVSKENNYLFII